MRGISILTVLFLLVACTDKPALQPTSSGRPYEVWVVATAETQARSIKATLATAAAGLPQEEPCFDSRFCLSSRFNAAGKLARNLIVVDTDPTLYSKVSITYERNTYATPQMLIHVQAPDRQALDTAFAQGSRYGKELLRLLNRHELTIRSNFLKRQHNPQAEQLVRDMFNIGMQIPADMQSSKRGKGFLWLSDNGTDGMQNICIFDAADIDSVLKANIPGEEDGMYMQTVAPSIIHEGGILRGLWQMEGDAMGGPFVARRVADPSGNRHLTVLAFVYAPGTTKRNRMRQLEAVLYTINNKQS